jgi:Glycosyltransferase family 87
MSHTLIAWCKPLAGPATVGVLLSIGVILRLRSGDSPRARLWTWRLAIFGWLTFAVYQFAVLAIFPDANSDLKAFLIAGRESIAGRDPYSSGGEMVALNPPSAQGVFRIAAALPYPIVAGAWSLLNAAMVLVLVPMANQMLAREREEDPDRAPPALPFELVALLSAALVNSNAALRGHRWGQLCALTAFALMAALNSRQLSRPWRAGAWLALAAFKPATALPFLALFLRRVDRRAWVALAGVSIVLTAIAAPPGKWPALFRNNLTQIGVAGEVGKINDFSYARGISGDMVSFNQMFNRFGLRDRRVIAGLQWMGVIIVLGVVGANWNRRPFTAAASLTAIGSMLVLYHRTYDAVVLALPIAYAAALSRSTTGRQRTWALVSVALLLAAIDQPREALIDLTEWSLTHGIVGRIVQMTVLSMPTWSVTAALFTLWTCVRIDGSSTVSRERHSAVPVHEAVPAAS